MSQQVSSDLSENDSVEIINYAEKNGQPVEGDMSISRMSPRDLNTLISRITSSSTITRKLTEDTIQKRKKKGIAINNSSVLFGEILQVGARFSVGGKRRKISEPESNPAIGIVDLDSTAAQPSTSTAVAVTERNDLAQMLVPMSTLLPLIMCVVCLDTLRIPFKMCPRGHLICSSCSPSVCPMCKAIIYLENPVCVKNILETLPRHCVQPDCKEIITGEPNCPHEMYCRFRQISCEKGGCEDLRVAVFQLKEHYQTIHREEQWLENESGVATINFQWCAGLHEIPVFVFDNIFWIQILKNIGEKLVDFSFSANFIHAPSWDFFADFKLENGESAVTCRVKASDSDAENVKKYPMKISYESVKEFVTDDKLTLHYEIGKKLKT